MPQLSPHDPSISPLLSHADRASAANTPDPSIAVRVAAGDIGAFEHIVSAYWAQILALSTRLLHDPEAANDIAQETFIRVWVNRREFQPGQLRAYIFKVARNLVVDETRKRVVRAQAVAIPFAIEQPDHVLERSEQRDAVQHAVDALPPRRRAAFILAYLHELSYKEAADVLGVSAATVKNHVAAALADLRRELAPHGSPLH